MSDRHDRDLMSAQVNGKEREREKEERGESKHEILSLMFALIDFKVSPIVCSTGNGPKQTEALLFACPSASVGPS